MTDKELKREYIASRKYVITTSALVFIALCVIGRYMDNYLVVAGAIVFAFVSYIVIYNKMMAFVENKK